MRTVLLLALMITVNAMAADYIASGNRVLNVSCKMFTLRCQSPARYGNHTGQITLSHSLWTGLEVVDVIIDGRRMIPSCLQMDTLKDFRYVCGNGVILTCN